MDFILLILIAPLIYLVLGTILGILATLMQTDNLRLKAALIICLRPIAYTYIFSLFVLSWFNTIGWLTGFAVIVYLRDLIFLDYKFLSGIELNDGHLSIRYLNTFLLKKTRNVALDGGTKLQLSEMRSIAHYPGALTVGEGDELQRFIILGKEMRDVAADCLQAAPGERTAVAG